MFDSASYIDISNFGNDNTPIEAVAEDFNKIVVGNRQKHIFLTHDEFVVLNFRANVGIFRRYSSSKKSFILNNGRMDAGYRRIFYR